MPNQPTVEEELAALTKGIKAMTKGNGPELSRHGVAEELAKFIEQHAEDMMKEAKDHLDTSKNFANEIRKLTDEHLEVLKNFTDSIKASQTGMSDVRTKFLQSRTTFVKGEKDAVDQRSASLDVPVSQTAKT